MDTKDKIIKWFLSGETGISSKTIVSQMTGYEMDREYADYPKDPGDFGRCHKLLEMAHEFKPRMKEMADRSPQWAALVEHWDELTELYLQNGNLYERMTQILSSAPDKRMINLGNGMSIFFSDNDK